MGLKLGYARLSDEDNGKVESIPQQKELITNYYRNVLNYHGEIIFFEDEDKTGMYFDRPGYLEMEKFVESNSVDILAFKDISRFGRGDGLTLIKHDKFVYEHDVRLIGVSDGYDSNDKGRRNTLGIFTWSNERYIRDISEKVYTNFKQRQENGNLIIQLPFGYKKQGKEILIDDYTSNIIKEIFELYINGYGYRKIAMILNEKKYMTPSVYKNRLNANQKWSFATIENILTNKFYIGTLEQRKTFKKIIKGKSKRNSDDKILKFENHHEPIIKKEMFELVQNIMESRRNNNTKGTKRNGAMHIFSSKIFCGKCHATYVFVKGRYICHTQFKYAKKTCNCMSVYENKLLEDIQIFIKSTIENNNNLLEKLKNKKPKNVNKLQSMIDGLQSQINKKEKNLQKVYIDKIQNESNIPEEIFNSTIKQFSEEIKKLKEQLSQIVNIKNEYDDQEKIITNQNEILNKFINKKLTRRDIEILIDKIIIDDTQENPLRIIWNTMKFDTRAGRITHCNHIFNLDLDLNLLF